MRSSRFGPLLIPCVVTNLCCVADGLNGIQMNRGALVFQLNESKCWKGAEIRLYKQLVEVERIHH